MTAKITTHPQLRDALALNAERRLIARKRTGGGFKGQLWQRVAEGKTAHTLRTAFAARYVASRGRIARRNGGDDRGPGPVVGYSMSGIPRILRVAPAASGVIRAGVRVK